MELRLIITRNLNTMSKRYCAIENMQVSPRVCQLTYRPLWVIKIMTHIDTPTCNKHRRKSEPQRHVTASSLGILFLTGSWDRNLIFCLQPYFTKLDKGKINLMSKIFIKTVLRVKPDLNYLANVLFQSLNACLQKRPIWTVHVG